MLPKQNLDPVQPAYELALRDKSLLIGNERGEVVPLTVEEVLAKRLNHWAGWYCAIGKESLHISPDGNIWGGACRNNGYLGNVYDQVYYLPSEWHKCTRRACSCGADMQIRKVKDLAHKDLTYRKEPGPIVEKVDQPVFAAPIHQSIHDKYPTAITWDLGRRCNYSCSYCHESISNNYEPHKAWGSLMFALDGLEKYFFWGRKAKFVFTGGEPTVNPKYMDFVRLLKEKGHLIHTTTNGSRTPEFFSELIELSLIGFSFHFEFSREDHYTKVIKAIIERKKQSKEAFDNWCGVRIMVPPGGFMKAKDLYHRLKEIDGFQEYAIMLSMSPLYVPEEHTILLDYPEGELEQISAFS